MQIYPHRVGVIGATVVSGVRGDYLVRSCICMS